MRVVSLVPSATESLIALGMTPVACTRFCEQPDLPTVGGTKNPDVNAIVALEPDLVVVNDEENRREDADALVAAGVTVHSMSPRAVGEVAPALAADTPTMVLLTPTVLAEPALAPRRGHPPGDLAAGQLQGLARHPGKGAEEVAGRLLAHAAVANGRSCWLAVEGKAHGATLAAAGEADLSHVEPPSGLYRDRGAGGWTP